MSNKGNNTLVGCSYNKMPDKTISRNSKCHERRGVSTLPVTVYTVQGDLKYK